MSASHYKQKEETSGGHQEKSTCRIPLPSFCSLPPSPPDSPEESRQPKLKKRTQNSDYVVKTCWNVDEISTLANFLDLQARKMGSHSNSPQLSIRLDDFFHSFLPKFREHLHSAVKSGNFDREKNIVDCLVDFSEGERWLYHLLAAGSPELYTIILKECSANEAAAGGIKYEASRWFLETLPVSPSTRLTQLRSNLTEIQSISKSKSDGILENLRKYREASRKRKEAKSRLSLEAAKKTQQALKRARAVPTLIQPGMSIDERVRIRAAAKQQRLERNEKQSSNDVDSKADREWLVRLADALWSHCSNILKRQRQFQSPKHQKTNSTASPVCMTLRDVVIVLQNAVSTSVVPNSGGESRQIQSKGIAAKVPAKKLAEAVYSIHRFVPEWIRITDPDRIEGSKLPSKNASVWISPLDYKTVRARLAGNTATPKPPTKRPAQPGGFLNSILHPHLKKQKKESSGNVTLTAKSSSVGTALQHPKRVAMAKSQQDDGGFLKRIPIASSRPFNRQINDRKQHLTYTPPAQKLRINPKLILSDADHQGGEIIPKSTFSSPRALKGLFIKMNRGERI